MQNMGISVLFKGNNFLRLCQGLWVTLRISLIAMIFSIILGFILGMIMTSKKQSSQIDLQNLSGNCKNYASTSVTFPCLFWGSQALGNEHAGRIGGGHSVHILGHG